MSEEEPQTTALRRWADEAMFNAESHETHEGHGVLPQVHLLWMTPDPLGAVAAMSEMYKGNVIRDMNDLTNEQRKSAWADVQKTHLQAPLEAIKLHFMIDGVDRAFTHQIVRQRTAVYAQESLRFAVVDNLADGTTLPPSLQYDPEEGPHAGGDGPTALWYNTLETIQQAYSSLVEDWGIPAEDARGLLPHATATRLNYITDLRNLSGHAGNRLCTQAQFHWRIVFSQIVMAIRNYVPPEIKQMALYTSAMEVWETAIDESPEFYPETWWKKQYGWQQAMIAESALFRPVCYQLNRCPFQASFDRHCSIRERVENFAAHGIPSEVWDDRSLSECIRNEEWLLNPSAARKR